MGEWAGGRPRRAPRAARLALLGLALLAAIAGGLVAAPGVGVAKPPAGARTIYLVRHGAYDESDPRDPDVGKGLVPRGREQSRLTGQRLAHLPARIDRLYASTMTRARQTAGIIGGELGGMRPVLSRDLRECTPPTPREDLMARLDPGEADACRATLERVWSRFFRPTSGRDSTEVIVCHGNVIRYLTCRTLGLDTRQWLNLQIDNCSLTVVLVRPDGAARLIRFDDAGHLPPALQ